MNTGDGLPNSQRYAERKFPVAKLWRVNFRSRLLALLLLVSSSLAPVADSGQAIPDVSPSPESSEQQQQALLDQLEDVVVSGEKPVKNTQQVINWLAHLAGKFTVEGNVDLQGKGNPDDLKAVAGSTNCVAFGLAPGIRCEITVRWPEVKGVSGEPVLGGVSTLDPGMILYGIEPRTNGIMHMIADNKGVGEPVVGLLFNNTLVSKSRCVNVPGICERVVHITVEPGAQIVRLQIDLNRDYKRAVSFGFVLRRVPGSVVDVIVGAPK